VEPPEQLNSRNEGFSIGFWISRTEVLFQWIFSSNSFSPGSADVIICVVRNLSEIFCVTVFDAFDLNFDIGSYF